MVHAIRDRSVSKARNKNLHILVLLVTKLQRSLMHSRDSSSVIGRPPRRGHFVFAFGLSQSWRATAMSGSARWHATQRLRSKTSIQAYVSLSLSLLLLLLLLLLVLVFSHISSLLVSSAGGEQN